MTGVETNGRCKSSVVCSMSSVTMRKLEPVAKPKRGLSWRVVAGTALALVVLSGALAVGAIPRLRQEKELNLAAAEAATLPPNVDVALARQAPTDSERILPGNAQPLVEASLYARATGYIKTRLVDIGDRVEEGQLLAVIAAPDIDDQLAQARANLEQARATLKQNEANYVLAKTVLARSHSISARGTGVISQEELDQEKAAADATRASVENARASIKVSEAAVQRYTDLQAFERIVAPFPGIVTARHIDVGDLVSADSTTRELFHLMRTDVLRVFVNVPQVFATDVSDGQAAAVYRREDPKRPFTGKVTRTANALDLNTRTLLTEVQVPNPEGALRPGMYLQVKFVFGRQVTPVLVPSAALATRANGPRVAVLDAKQQVHYREVKLGRDYGAEVEVVAGLNAGEQVVVHPGDDLPEGKTVVPAAKN